MTTTTIRTAIKNRAVRALELMAYADYSGMVYMDGYYPGMPLESEAAAPAQAGTARPAASAPRHAGRMPMPVAA